VAQLEHVSSPLQTPSPHAGAHAPQSSGHEEQVSAPVHVPSPQLGSWGRGPDVPPVSSPGRPGSPPEPHEGTAMSATANEAARADLDVQRAMTFLMSASVSLTDRGRPFVRAFFGLLQAARNAQLELALDEAEEALEVRVAELHTLPEAPARL